MMTQTEKRRQWQELLERFEQEGVSGRAFCTRYGLNYSTFRYRQRTLSEITRGDEDEDVACVEILRNSAMSTCRRNECMVEAESIRVTIPGYDAEVTVTGRLSLSQLQRILDACGVPFDVSA